MKNQTNTTLAVRSSLAVALALAIWSPVYAQSPAPAEGKTMTAATMMESCQKMKQQKQDMKDDIKAQDAQLKEQLASMNRAPDDQKTGLMAALLTTMVDQRIAMDARKAQMEEAMMQHMMQHMQMSKESIAQCPMMKDMKGMKGMKRHERHEGHEGDEGKHGRRLQGTTRGSEMIADKRGRSPLAAPSSAAASAQGLDGHGGPG
ncbi:MAG: hypothetical protein ABI822_15375 [Bryobacteraceae bacterium]